MWEWKPQDPSAWQWNESERRIEPVNVDGYEQGENEMSFRDIIGDEDTRVLRSDHNGYNLTVYPLHSIGALNPDGTPDNAPNSGCTATKFGPRHLLTAGHCVNVGGLGSSAGWIDRDWWSGQDGMDQYFNAGDPSPNGVKNIEWYWVHPGWLNDKDDKYDYAVLMLFDNQNSCNFGWFGVQTDGSLANTAHWHFGFPGNQVCEQSPHPADSCAQSMWGTERDIARTTIRFAFYPHDTQNGHSGGPLYEVISGDRYIHAIHQGPYSSSENQGVKVINSLVDNIVAVRNVHPSSYCSP